MRTISQTFPVTPETLERGRELKQRKSVTWEQIIAAGIDALQRHPMDAERFEEPVEFPERGL
jgi:hypothetical protein